MTIKEADFIKNERPGEYEARFSIEGEVRVWIKAASLKDAQGQARSMLDEEDFGRELDNVVYAQVERVRKSSAMFLVTRDGRSMQVSCIEEGDQPRQPDDQGF